MNPTVETITEKSRKLHDSAESDHFASVTLFYSGR